MAATLPGRPDIPLRLAFDGSEVHPVGDTLFSADVRRRALPRHHGEMTPAGYSGTPLARKLDILAGHRVLLERPPQGLVLAGLPQDVRPHRRISGPLSYDVVVTFCADRARFDNRLPALIPHLATAGALWVAWPKRSSGVATDLTENVVRDSGIAHGLVDVKVCAIDAIWSGLKLVRRLRDR